MLSTSEASVLQKFRQYHMTPHKMLCFCGQDLKSKEPALNSLVKKQLLVREQFQGAYSLTRAGYTVMQSSA